MEAKLGPRAVFKKREFGPTSVDMSMDFADGNISGEVAGGVKVNVGGSREVAHRPVAGLTDADRSVPQSYESGEAGYAQCTKHDSHKEAHWGGEESVHRPSDLAPNGRRWRLGSDDLPKHVRHNRADDIVEGDVSLSTADITPLVLWHPRDSGPGTRPRERLLTRLDVLKAENAGAGVLSLQGALARLVGGHHLDAPEGEQQVCNHAEALIRAPEQGEYATPDIREPVEQSEEDVEERCEEEV